MSIKVYNIRLDKEHLESDQSRMNAFLDTVNVKLTASNFVTTGTIDYWSVLIFYDAKSGRKIPVVEQELTNVEEEKFLALKSWRNNKAKSLNLPQYMISYNSELKAIAVKKPKTITALRKIKGFGDIKTAKFGEEIIALVQTD